MTNNRGARQTVILRTSHFHQNTPKANQSCKTLGPGKGTYRISITPGQFPLSADGNGSIGNLS